MLRMTSVPMERTSYAAACVSGRSMQAQDIHKQRDIVFAALPPDQVPQALQLLTGLEGLSALPSGTQRCGVVVGYSVLEFTLEGLESALTDQGFHLDNSLVHKLRRALIYYCERVQRENLRVPQRETKAREIFINAYQQHPHGDHDETPEEWRCYR